MDSVKDDSPKKDNVKDEWADLGMGRREDIDSFDNFKSYRE